MARDNQKDLLQRDTLRVMYEDAATLIVSARPPSLEQLIQASPNKELGYLKWMIRLIKTGSLTNDNMEETAFHLHIFHEIKKKAFFKAAKASPDIMTYKTPRQLIEALDLFRALWGEQGRKKIEREKRREIEQDFIRTKKALVLANTSQFKIVIPLSVQAAQFYGQNTKWCTSARESGNGFYAYATHGPSIRILMKGSQEKFGINFSLYHFVDKENKEVKFQDISEKYPAICDYLEPYIFDILKYDARCISSIPEKFLTPQKIYKHFADDIGMYVPRGFWTKNFTKKVIQKDPFMSVLVPPEIMAQFRPDTLVKMGARFVSFPEDRITENLIASFLNSSHMDTRNAQDIFK